MATIGQTEVSAVTRVEDLPPRVRAAVLLAMGRRPEEIGPAVGVSGRTVRRWRERPEMRADIRRVRLRLLDGALAAERAEVGE
ncbi:helix-turn-helix domain-containing protein [Streptomyces tendae]|uniref:helix-turn-helix domain-containing protein n=1 Tax=Streptomyces tendae TaxID=1932 RepID=UPI0037FC0CA8